MIKLLKTTLILILFYLPQSSLAETNLTPWNFKITTSDKLIYAGHANIGMVKNTLIQNNIVSKSKMNSFIKSLDSKKIIYIFSKTHKLNSINANTQRDTSKLTSNKSEIQKLCKDMNYKYNSMVKVKLEQTNCNLEYYKNKIDSEKFSKNFNDEIKSILFYGHKIPKYNRYQLQYYIKYRNKVTTFTLGCSPGECSETHKELIEIINSIEFI
jgi:hypothetical protein